MPRSIRPPRDIEARLTALADEIREHLTDLEDIDQAERELIEVRAGRSIATPLAQVMSEYGLED